MIFELVASVQVETGILHNPALKRNFLIDKESSNVDEITNHPNYDADTNDNDIAILKLKKPLTFTKDVQPACLPDPSFSPEEGELGVVSGWGRTRGKILFNC